MAKGKRTKAAHKKAGLKKSLITARQKRARKLNIEIARQAKKKKGQKVKMTRFGNPVAGKPKKITVFVEKKGRR